MNIQSRTQKSIKAGDKQRVKRATKRAYLRSNPKWQDNMNWSLAAKEVK